LLDNPNANGANGEEPRGFDANEFMGHYTCVRLFFIFFIFYMGVMVKILEGDEKTPLAFSRFFIFFFVHLLLLPPPFRRRRYRRYGMCVERK
jgi:hypothetical protein